MIPNLSIKAIRDCQSPEQLADNQKKTLEELAKFNQAQRKLEEHCERNGLEVPIMVC
ncbi:hypothetical protein RVBP21_2540 [Pseudomonas phage BRkr]|nr:hypothetical protein RVBP21_2540 [Pseudomonas phage BRkr]